MLEFKECSTCAAKPGSPDLCPGCLQNRWVIESYQRRLKDTKEMVENNIIQKFNLLHNYLHTQDLNILERKGLELLCKDFTEERANLFRFLEIGIKESDD